MKATEILMQEHRVIEQVLTCVERMVEEAKVSKRLDLQPARDAIEFIRQFADKCHHAKEEDQLFVMMVERGVPERGGPIEVMLNEHEFGRQRVGLMAKNAQAASEGDEVALEVFTENARAFIDMLRDHIMKEDRILYPIGDQVFSEADQQELLLRFENAEQHDVGEGVHEKYLAIAEALGNRYQVSLPETLPKDACFGCGHHCG